MPQNSPLRISLVLAWLLFVAHAFAATERVGQVTFSGLPLPGATVVATMGDARATTTTDQQGMFRFADLADGVWTFHVEMTGFVPITRDVTIGADAAIPPFELTLRPFAEVQREAGAGAPTAARSTSNDPLPQGIVSSAAAQASAAAARSGATTGVSGGNASGAASGQSQSSAAAANTASANAASANSASANATTAAAAGATGSNTAAAGGDPFGTADGLLINGSVNNGAASPFAQSAAFGNNRPGQRSVYNGGVGLILGNSAWDARPYSFSSVPSQKPVYTDYQFLGSFGGPIRFPGVRTRSTLFLGYQRIADTNTTTQSAIVPTLLERNGDFSESLDAFGQPVQVIDPETGLPFKDGVIPPERMSPQARALLGYYPTPNAAGSGRFNYQAPIVAASHQDNVQARLTHALSPRDQLATSASYQRTSIDTLTLFGFEDSTVTSGFDVMAQWQHRLSLFMTTRLRYQFTTLSTSTTPFFAGTRNVSGDAGIGGNNQDPSNWGPPTLGFSSGIAGLTDVQFARNRNQTHAWGSETLWSHNRHNLTFGGDLRLVHNNIESQQDPRGTFGFTGALTASDLGDFLLGVPHTSSIAFGNADKFLRSSGYDAYLSDDWRVSPALTVTAGVRWEFEAPITETQDRLANLDIAKEFTNTASVTAAAPSGALTGELYPRSLIRSDPFGIQPRLGVAWRPIPGSSLVIRGG
ncbi:MAG TPA: carboxypeptidase regulatory-like domain-containing protein, partial [Vicinamibacterales bacterium]|nr:carboxypeptidase regulatory-like domain-containing protein [Vicinamibacterales bacterium]